MTLEYNHSSAPHSSGFLTPTTIIPETQPNKEHCHTPSALSSTATTKKDQGHRSALPPRRPIEAHCRPSATTTTSRLTPTWASWRRIHLSTAWLLPGPFATPTQGTLAAAQTTSSTSLSDRDPNLATTGNLANTATRHALYSRETPHRGRGRVGDSPSRATLVCDRLLYIVGTLLPASHKSDSSSGY